MVRLGDLGLTNLGNPTSESAHAFEASKRITAPLVALIVAQDLQQGEPREMISRKKRTP